MSWAVLSHRILRLLWCIVALGAATAAAADDPKAPNMEAVGAQLATIFNERKADALVAMLDMGALGARVAANVFDSERGRSEFARGFAKTAQAKTLVSDIFGQLDRSPGSATKFMRVVTRGAEQRPLLRFDYSGMRTVA